MFWPVKLGVAMMKRKAPTISATSTPRPSALSSCTASKLARLCGPETRVTEARSRTPGSPARSAGAKLSKTGKPDLGDGVAVEVRIGCRDLGIEQVDDQSGPGPDARRKRLRQQGRRPQIDIEMRVPARRIERPGRIEDEARRIVDEQAWRRKAVERGHDRIGGVRFGEIGLDDSGRPDFGSERARFIERTFAVDKDVPAVGRQSARNLRADPPGAASHDRGAWSFELTPHGSPDSGALCAWPASGYSPFMSFLPDPPADFSGLGLAEIARLAEERKLPPVERWDPPHCGDSRMRIARDGTWFHEGSPIGRPAMVRLFSSILRREADGGFVLVTPVEKLTIDVEDAPFNASNYRRGAPRPGAAFRPTPAKSSLPGQIIICASKSARTGRILSGGRAGWRPGRAAGLLRARRDRPREADPPACGAAAPSSRWSRARAWRRSCAALEQGTGRAGLITGDVPRERRSAGITPAAVLVAVVDRPGQRSS